ncbi:MAG: DUF5715 family protein [Candidatus Peribacteria bacterium]|jgi:hypothetical protein|nr:DUF5715 family protein [Candidatus Peribacteria bacterium]
MIIISGSIIGCSSPDKKESNILSSSYIGNYKADFNDLLKDYKDTARKVGITPIKNRKVAETKKKDLVEIKNGKYYVIDPEMNRSIPFLVPHAKNLLDEIGREFSDSLSTLGYPRYQLIISSVWRTEEDIKNMKKIDHNENVSKDSPHRFGIAFDLKYLSFEKVEGNDKDIDPEELQRILASVLLNFKEDAWITYETEQACFHIVSKGTYILSPRDLSTLSAYTVE